MKRIWKPCQRARVNALMTVLKAMNRRSSYMEILADRSSLTAYVSSRIGDLFTRRSWGGGKKIRDVFMIEESKVRVIYRDRKINR